MRRPSGDERGMELDVIDNPDVERQRMGPEPFRLVRFGRIDRFVRFQMRHGLHVERANFELPAARVFENSIGYEPFVRTDWGRMSTVLGI